MLTEALPKTRPLAAIISIALHGAVIAGLLYSSVNTKLTLPTPEKAINVELVAPQVQTQEAAKSSTSAPPEATAAQPTQPPKVEPKVEPELKQPVAIAKPVHQQKTPAKPVVKPKPKPVTPPKKTATEKTVENPFAQNSSQPQNQPKTAPQRAPQQDQSISQGPPQRVTTVNPSYPARALALQMEGRVKVTFDVDNSGRVVNLQVVEAQPRNMFDREVKRALSRWRYQPGRAASQLSLTIFFRIDGSTAIQ